MDKRTNKILIIVSTLVTVFSAIGFFIATVVPILVQGSYTLNSLCLTFFTTIEIPIRIGVLAGFALAIIGTKFRLLYFDRWKWVLIVGITSAALVWSFGLYIANLPLPSSLMSVHPDAFQLILFNLDYTHLGSNLTFIGLFLASALLTKKPVFALVITLGCVGFIEFTCIPLHYFIFDGAFMGIAWYLPFALAIYPFIVSIPKFKLTHKRLFILVLIIAEIVHVFVSLLAKSGWSFVYWDTARQMFVDRPLADFRTGIGLTLYDLLARSAKVFVAIPFTFIRPKSEEELQKCQTSH